MCLKTPTGDAIIWLDDHSRYALSVTVHRRVTAAIVAATSPTRASRVEPRDATWLPPEAVGEPVDPRELARAPSRTATRTSRKTKHDQRRSGTL
jgi:hypothetical protein